MFYTEEIKEGKEDSSTLFSNTIHRARELNLQHQLHLPILSKELNYVNQCYHTTLIAVALKLQTALSLLIQSVGMYHFAALHPAQWESTRTTVTLTTRDGHFYLRSVLMHNPANYSQYFKEQQLHLVERFNTAGLFLHEVNNANSALHSSRQGFY